LRLADSLGLALPRLVWLRPAVSVHPRPPLVLGFERRLARASWGRRPSPASP